MSQEVLGASLKEWSMIILMVSLAFTFGIVGVGFVIAMWNAPEDAITISGTFDLGQWQAIVIGIAITATVLVSQQLTKKDNAIMLSFLKDTFNNGNGSTPANKPSPLDELPDMENPEEDEVNTLHEEIPDEVPPTRPET